MELSGIVVYPIKSCRGVAVEARSLQRRGLDGDRRWMLVDGEGNFVTQREAGELCRVDVALGDAGYALSAPGRAGLEVPRGIGQGARVQVSIWKSVCAAREFEPGSRWFSELLQRELRLVYMPDDVERAVDLDYGRPGDVVSFADGFPLLVIGEASLADLNARLAEPVEMRRFRPNLMVRGGPAYQEETWERFRIGAIGFRAVKPCSRCVMVTRDPVTGAAGKEPLATLSSYRKSGGEVCFGMNVIADGLGELRVGDRLSVESSRAKLTS